LPRRLLGDAGRLRQIIINLVGNALKFTEQGHIHVHVSCTEQDAQRARLCVRVEDTGIGISAEAQARLFQPFSQVDSSRHRKYEGAGLGLAIVRILVEAMGGTISCASEPGRGSAFTFTVPLEKTEAKLLSAPAGDAAPLPRRR
jgi:signal transduction histidine kinase